MIISRNLALFAVAIALFALLQVFLQQSNTLLWSGAESAMAWVALNDSSNLRLPEYYYQWLWTATGGDVSAFRFPSTVLLFLGLAAFILLSRALFGFRTALLSAMVAVSTLSLPFLGKVATLDSLLLALHGTGWLTLLQCAKQPRLTPALIFYSLLLIAGIIHPWSTLVFFALGTAVLWTDRKRYPGLKLLKPWWGLLLLPAIAWLTKANTFQQPWLFLGSDYSLYLLFLFAGFLPFIGFVLAGFRDYLGKIRKGDEFSRILMGWLGAALLCASPAAFWLLALLVARQMDAFFKNDYPYRNWVKTGAILHLVFSFFAAMAILIYGIYEFGAAGFRATVGAVGIYWSMSFLGIIGIFGARKQLTIGAPILAGSLFMLIAWLLAWPLLETGRKENLSVLEGLDEKVETVIVSYKDSRNFPNLSVYGKMKYPEKTWKVIEKPLPTDLPAVFYLFANKNTENIPPECRDTIRYGQDYSLLLCQPVSESQ
jgi:hypothetical protein